MTCDNCGDECRNSHFVAYIWRAADNMEGGICLNIFGPDGPRIIYGCELCKPVNESHLASLRGAFLVLIQKKEIVNED